MRNFALVGTALAIWLTAIPALAQLPQLPVVDGYPIEEVRPHGAFLPTIWTDGADSWVAYADEIPGLLLVYQESLAADMFLYGTCASGSSGDCLYAPDVFASFVVGEYIAPPSGLPETKIASFDYVSQVSFDLSPLEKWPDSHRRPSMGDQYAVWVKIGCGLTCDPHGLYINEVDGSPHSYRSILSGASWRYDWPNIWSNYVAFEVSEVDPSNQLLQVGIGLHEIEEPSTQLLLDPFAEDLFFRYAPHIADGRIVYHVRDAPHNSATYSTIRYTDIASWGVEVEPLFLQ